MSKRENLLENLLVLLNSANDLGVGTSIVDLGPWLEEGVGAVSSARGLKNGLVFFIFLSAYSLARLQFVCNRILQL